MCVRADIRIDSSHDPLGHTLARLPDSRKSTSDLISSKLARYDFLKLTFFLDDGRVVIGARKG